MITLHNPTSATYQQFDDWGGVVAALDAGELLIDNGIMLTPDICFARSRSEALQQIADRHAEMLTAATGGATAAERDTWIVKEQAAAAVIAGATTSGVLRPVGDETLPQLAQKILVKAAGYKMLVGVADQIKRTAEKAVEAVKLEKLDDLSALESALNDASNAASAAMDAINN